MSNQDRNLSVAVLAVTIFLTAELLKNSLAWKCVILLADKYILTTFILLSPVCAVVVRHFHTHHGHEYHDNFFSHDIIIVQHE